ncbi:MAG TPA: ATP-binding cassette domain-containing protein [Spirochaetia bacterium]|nr:ATP-binding cassette domain-containing protein [Spirochaetia bacterium]
MVSVQHAVKRFDQIVAVDNVSLKASPGEIFGLIGPNGAGKSTIIKIIINIIQPDSGTVDFAGRRMIESDKERIGYLPEERGLYRSVRVGEMLTYLADLKGKRPRDSAPVIDGWLERFDLMNWKHRKISELSKGMAQKVQFIGAIAHEPEVLIFDEPFSGLDPVSSDLLLGSIQELARQGRTVLFSTHIMEQAERICSKILLINHGKEIISGTVAKVRERYGSNSVIVEFDGNIDFVRGLPFVSNAMISPRWAEIELAEPGSHGRLYEALAGKVLVRRFELVSPTLHRIFVQLVGEGAE